MKKILISALGFAAVASALSLSAANDRIDFYDKDGNFVSVMTDDIESMSVSRDPSMSAEDGYSILNIVTSYGEKSCVIADLKNIIYTQLDEFVPFEIKLNQAPNSEWVLWNAHNNLEYPGGIIDPSKPTGWRGAPYDYTVLFDTRCQKGYRDHYDIVGQYTGKVYSENPLFVFVSLPDMNTMGVESFAYHMPFEPVTMNLYSEELTTYNGMPFLGTYSGAKIAVNNDKRIVSTDVFPFSIEMKGNTTFHMLSGDEDNFDVTDLYIYNEERNSFAYVPYEGDLQNSVDVEVKTGVSGQFVNDDFVLITAIDILEDKPENTRRYIASRKPFTFTLATNDNYDTNYLLQAKPKDGSEPFYFYITTRGSKRTAVTLDFISGDDISTDCSAYVCDAETGDRILRYDIAGGENPVFTVRGAEYGDYNGANGSVLNLDGFGKLNLDGIEGTYEIDGGVIMARVYGLITMYVVDRDARTFVEMSGDEWTGADTYTNDAMLGTYAGHEINNLNNMTITFNKNPNGTDAPGQASVIINICSGEGFNGNYIRAASTVGKYIYNAEEKTLIITNLYLGTSPTTSTRRNLKLHVSDDMKSMWIDDVDDEVIYSTDRSNSYILTGPQNTLRAPKPAVTVELADKYTGNWNIAFSSYATPEAIPVTLDIDKANEQATLTSVYHGYEVLSGTVSYEFDGNKLTLKEFPVGDGTWSQVPTFVDLHFTIEEDGSLLAAESSVYANHSYFTTYTIDPSSAPLVPETVKAELAETYTGEHQFTSMGRTDNGESTLTLDKANSKATMTYKAMGTIFLDGTVDYEFDGTTLTLKGYTVGDGGYGSKTVDLVFTLEADGTLSSTMDALHPSDYSYNSIFEIDFTSAVFVPAEE
ncbi:MAG: hypothetical protein NC336_06160 [Clostridium sp.]|nr:hypothetical protein [Clostridium sp.]